MMLEMWNLARLTAEGMLEENVRGLVETARIFARHVYVRFAREVFERL